MCENSFRYCRRNREKKAKSTHSTPNETVIESLEGVTLFFGHKLVLDLTKELVNMTTGTSKGTRLASLA